MQLISKLKQIRKELAVAGLILAVAGVSHGLNMFGFPYYENDEGTYVSQAWAIWTQNKLAPYTYWYDHAPGGWIQIAAWQAATGLFTFGTSVDSGRVLMLVFHVAIAVLMWLVTRKISGNNLAGVVAGVFFSLSPLWIYYQRRVLLDNIAIFWVMLSLALVIVPKKMSLVKVMLAATCLGIAVLSKEVAVYFGPGLLAGVWWRAEKNRAFAVTLWLSVVGLIVGSYFLLAALKGELLPAGFGGDDRPRVSLIGSLQQQLSRGIDKNFWEEGSMLYGSWKTWEEKDELSLKVGLAAWVTGILASIVVKKWRILAVTGAGFAWFLINSKLIIDFYIIPAVPFAAMFLGLAADGASKIIKNNKARAAAGAGLVILTAAVSGHKDIGQYGKDESKSQRQAIEYIKQNLEENTFLVTDASILVDLWEERVPGEKVFRNADWAWKVEKDAEIYGAKLKNDWRNIDYLVLSHEQLRQMREFEAKFLKRALEHSTEVKMWNEDSTAFVDIDKTISTNGDWMALFRVKDETDIVLESTWNYYADNFIKSYGQVVDPANGNTTSEGQTYAMLRAVWVNDRNRFDGVWNWTKDHMQHRNDDKLLSWLWKDDKLADSATASDADVDAALALILAYEKWGEAKYLEEAKALMADIWRKEVMQIGFRYVLTAGSDMKRGNGYIVNPSYFSPAHYRVFARYDKEADWIALADDSYWLLERLQAETGLVPNWVWINENSAGIGPADRYGFADAEKYGFDAFRTFFRVGLDAYWYENPRAKLVLGRVRPFFAEEWANRKGIAGIYNLNGEPAVSYNNLAGTMAALTVFKVLEPELARAMYQDKLAGAGDNNLKGYWEDANNYYDQNWAWFGTALYLNRVRN